MKAIIMAGGKGTRLKPLTCSYPKPMVPMLDRPVMAYTVDLLKQHGIREIGVTLAYMPEAIMDHFGQGEAEQAQLTYFIEDTPLGTGGSVRNAETFMDETLLVVSGDALTDLNIREALAFHQQKQAKVTLVLKQESYPTEYGVVMTDEGGRVVGFLEKPSWGEVFSNTINTGIYILEPEVLLGYAKGEPFDFSKDLFPKLLADQVPLYGYVTEAYWCDIGNLEAYQQTHFDLLEKRAQVPELVKRLKTGIHIGEGTVLGKGVVLEPPLYLGRNCIIEDGVHLIGPTVVGDDAVIGEGSILKRSILWKQVHLGRQVNLRGSVICAQAELKQRVKCLENVVVGEKTILEAGVLVKPDVKIWPQKRIEENTIVNQNLIWGTRASKTLFGFREIGGEVNTELTPEFAAKVGAAFASILPEQSTLVVGGEATPSARLLQYGLIAGMASTGAHVVELKESLLPMTRFAVRLYGAQGAVHVRRSPLDPQHLLLEFMNHQGGNLSRGQEREIENLFIREEFRRAHGSHMRSTTVLSSVEEPFSQAGLSQLQELQRIKERDLTLWVASSSVLAVESLSSYLKKLGIRVKTLYPVATGGFAAPEEQLNRLVEQVTGQEAIGVWISPCGEELTLLDERGRVLTREQFQFLAVQLLLDAGSADRFVLPYAAPRGLVKLVSEGGAQIHQSKSSPAALMEAMLNGSSGLHFTPQFNYWFNGIWSMGHLLDHLVASEKQLADLVDQVPVFYLVRKEIPCDWKDKGKVMKEMTAAGLQSQGTLLEGIRIDEERGWTLILPDAARPFVNILAEGSTQEYAEELSGFYTEKIKEVLNRH